MKRSFLSLISILVLQGLGPLLFSQTLTTYTVEDGLLDDNVHSICRGQADALWFGTQSGVSYFDGSGFTGSIEVEDGLIHETVFTVLCDNAGDVWMGTDFGLSRYNGTSCTTYTTEDGLEDNRIKHLYEDVSGLIWIGHNDGVSSFDGAAFTNYTMSDGLPFGGVGHVTQDLNGDMWFGTGLGGAYRFDGEAVEMFGIDEGLPNISVRSIAVDAANNKWIGTNEGIVVLDSNNEVLEDHPSLIELPPPHVINPVEDVKIDLEGRVWTGVYVDYLVTVGGVAYFNGMQWIDYNESDGLAGPNVRQLAVAANGDVWSATSTGATRFSGTPASIAEALPFHPLVFPNPASDFITVALGDFKGSKTGIRLYDSFGRTVYQDEVLSTTSIQVLHLSRGVYTLELSGNARAFQSQIIIE
jgi:ligand-binding sensor domain-containing protein